VAQAGSARAAKTQFDNGFGDALITYEQDALWSRSHSVPSFEIIYPRSTILSEHTLVVMEPNISGERRKSIRAFADFFWTDEAQRLFVSQGFRNVNEELNAGNREFCPIADPFLIKDFGGWEEAKGRIVDETWKNGVLKEIGP